jgi:tetratricopeptide (TPR) repeat protein
VANLHVATTLGPRVLAEVVPAKLAALGDAVPAAVRDAADPLAMAEALGRAGAAADDTGEPSWGALGHLVRETLFVQVYRRLDFLKGPLGVPVDEFWAAARPAVADHRYRPFLESLAQPPEDAARTLAGFAARLDRTDLEMTEAPMIVAMFRTPAAAAKGMEAWRSAWNHTDSTVRDYALAVEASGDKERPALARALLEFDPHSDLAMATLVRLDWDAVKDKVPAWEKSAGAAPGLLHALAQRYTGQKQYDEAEKVLTRYIRISSDANAYEMLADTYKARGDLGRWKETLDGYLAGVEDHGLSHAAVRVRIARHYMGQKRWEDARPYAEAAAETWAAWAMKCAAECDEQFGDWDAAELWTRRTTERYPETSWADWYRFCKRTGHGDVEAARAWTGQYLAAAGDRADLANPLWSGYFSWSAGAPERALVAFARAIEADPSQVMAVAHAALVADELGETKQRDELLERFCTRYKAQAPKSVELAEIFRGWLASGAKGAPDLAAADRVIQGAVPDSRGNLEFFVGRTLMAHGKPEAGLAYLRRSAASAKTYEWLRYIADDAVARAERGATP